MLLNAPITTPFKQISELLDWSPGHDPFNVAIVDLAARESPPCGVNKPSSKLMLCHDMNGGYNEDRFPQGGDESFVYNFFYWQHIDQFVYFSHKRVSIPPPVWTNAAHRNGVKMLGTVMLENHNDSDQEFLELMYGPCFHKTPQDLKRSETLQKLCGSGQDTSMFYADQLVAMAKYYGFKGWLLNFETPVPGEDAPFDRFALCVTVMC